MSMMDLPVPGRDLQAELSIAQFVIPAGAGGLFSNANASNVGAGGVCTFTTNAAHGLTLNPAAGVPPNYFVTFGASSSAITGTGILVGNIFRILTIPSTTTFTFWSTISTATVTSTTVIPVFFPNFLGSANNSGFAGGPTQTISSVVTPFATPFLQGNAFYARLAANCAFRVNTDQNAVILDALSTASLSGGTTPATAPTWRDQIAASTNGMGWAAPPWGALWANGTTATSTISVIN